MAWAFLDDAGSSPSRSLALACASFCVGIAVGPFIGMLGGDAPAFAVLFLAVPILFLRGTKAFAGTLVCAGLAVGIARSLIPLTFGIPTPAFATAIHDSMFHLLERLVSEPVASFLFGLIFGGSSNLPRGLKTAFQATGTSHILSASGFNVSIVSFVFLNWIIQTPVGRKRGIVLSFILLVAYVLAAGAVPSVVRAGIMAGVLLVGLSVRRRSSVMNVLLLAAALMLAANPSVIADVGFQLSFAATAAIMLAGKRFEGWLEFLPKNFGIRESFAASLAAIIATTPIILWHFGTFSLIAPLANFLILPLVPYAMALTFAALAVGVVSVALGTIAALPAQALGLLMLAAVSSFAAVPYANVSPSNAHLLALLTGAAAVGFFAWLPLATNKKG